MKLHFESDLDYQHAAIEAVCDLFQGQEICLTEFTVIRSASGNAYLPGLESALGIGNRLAAKFHRREPPNFLGWEPPDFTVRNHPIS
jgi:hypothetical protein